MQTPVSPIFLSNLVMTLQRSLPIIRNERSTAICLRSPVPSNARSSPTTSILVTSLCASGFPTSESSSSGSAQPHLAVKTERLTAALREHMQQPGRLIVVTEGSVPVREA